MRNMLDGPELPNYDRPEVIVDLIETLPHDLQVYLAEFIAARANRARDERRRGDG